MEGIFQFCLISAQNYIFGQKQFWAELALLILPDLSILGREIGHLATLSGASVD
mgnify:CR=1 FL=1